jgi:hypothetical protein
MYTESWAVNPQHLMEMRAPPKGGVFVCKDNRPYLWYTLRRSFLNKEDRMSVAAAMSPKVTGVPQVKNLRGEVEEALTNRLIDSSQFIGRRVRIDGNNYVHETTISGVLIAFILHKKFEGATLRNVRFTLTDSVVSIKKKRYQVIRTIDHLSYAYGWATDNLVVINGDMKVIFKDDGAETIKNASIDLLD